MEKIKRGEVKKGDIVWNSILGATGIFVEFCENKNKQHLCLIKDSTGDHEVNIINTWMADKIRKDNFLKSEKNKKLLNEVLGQDYEEEEEEDEVKKEPKKEKNNNIPMPIKELFKKLTKSTMPGGNESLVEKYLPNGYQKDFHGNYYIKVGDKTTVMFTSHVDTADYGQPKNVVHVERGDFIETDGKTILGADDKAGTAIMIYMIEHKVPGLYYFFLNEEHGCVGSRALNTYLNSHRDDELYKDINKVVALDRRDYDSVITFQVGERCCSEEFAAELAKRLNEAGGFKYKQDPTGAVTDSHQVADKFPECTNLSVGYDDQHTVREKQNIVFLQKLADACCKIDWETLPVKRDPTKTESRWANDYGRRSRYHTDWEDDSRWWEGGGTQQRATSSAGPGSIPSNAEYVKDYLGNDIRVADAVWCEYDKAWCTKDDAIWVEYIGFHTCPDFDPTKVKKPVSSTGGLIPLEMNDIQKDFKIYNKEGELFGTIIDVSGMITIQTTKGSKFIIPPDKILTYEFRKKLERGGNKLTEKDLKEGLIVFHPSFGEGRIIGIRTDKMIVKVQFKEKGEKDLRIDVADMKF